MKNLESILSSPQTQNVLRRHHITTGGMEGIRQGYNLKGSHFMIDLVKANSPGSVLHGNYGNNSDILSSVDKATAAEATGKGWAAWEKVLNLLGKTGETVAAVKRNVLGSPNTPTAAEAEAATATKRNNTIIYVVAVIIIVTVGFLLFYKRK